MKIFILILTVSYFVLVFVLPTYRVWKRTGINPIAFTKEDNAYNFIGKLFKLVIILLLINVLFYAILGSWYEYLGAFDQLENKFILKYIGLALIFVSLWLILIAQSKMADSWRIGIDHDNKTQLVTSGIFGISRNPIFLGVQIALLGIFCLTPNCFMMILVIVGVIIIQIQVRLEEEFLESQFMDYIQYKNKTKRWI